MADGPKNQQSQAEPAEPNPTESGSAEPDAGGRTDASRFKIARDEFRGLFGSQPRHRRLHGRLIGILTLSLVLDVVIAFVLVWFDSFSDKPGRSFGRAFAWTSSQMLVGGSSYAAQSGSP